MECFRVSPFGNLSLYYSLHNFINVDCFIQASSTPWTPLNLPSLLLQVELTPMAIAAGRRLSDRLFGGMSDAKADYTNVPVRCSTHQCLARANVILCFVILVTSAILLLLELILTMCHGICIVYNVLDRLWCSPIRPLGLWG